MGKLKGGCFYLVARRGLRPPFEILLLARDEAGGKREMNGMWRKEKKRKKERKEGRKKRKIRTRGPWTGWRRKKELNKNSNRNKEGFAFDKHRKKSAA